MMGAILSRIASSVENRLESYFHEVEKKPVSSLFDTRASSILLDQVRSLTLRGGKRLRAALLVQTAALFDARAEEQQAVIDAAAALELLHTYFLIHDDIMDDDEMRRGGPSVHVALSQEVGDPNMGRGLAILAGDLAASLKQVLLTGMDLDESRRRRVDQIFAAVHLDVVHGQALDMLGKTPALEVAVHKTASYTTVGPMAAGAALAGAPESDIVHLAKVALPLGIAFQLRDDLLGVFGSSIATGKPVGTDLKKGKQTYLFEKGLELADERQRGIIDAVVGHEEALGKDIKAACRALDECGARSACEKRVAQLVEEFKRGIERGQYLAQGKRFLMDVANFIAEREG